MLQVTLTHEPVSCLLSAFISPYAFIVLSAGASFLGELRGTVGIPKEAVEPSTPMPETIAAEEEDLDREEDVVPAVKIGV